MATKPRNRIARFLKKYALFVALPAVIIAFFLGVLVGVPSEDLECAVAQPDIGLDALLIMLERQEAQYRILYEIAKYPEYLGLIPQEDHPCSEQGK